MNDKTQLWFLQNWLYRNVIWKGLSLNSNIFTKAVKSANVKLSGKRKEFGCIFRAYWLFEQISLLIVVLRISANWPEKFYLNTFLFHLSKSIGQYYQYYACQKCAFSNYSIILKLPRTWSKSCCWIAIFIIKPIAFFKPLKLFSNYASYRWTNQSTWSNWYLDFRKWIIIWILPLLSDCSKTNRRITISQSKLQ